MFDSPLENQTYTPVQLHRTRSF